MEDPTGPDQTRPPEVNDRQSIAIDTLISGATHREAAQAAGVQRSTVTGWCNHNIVFIAEWNQRRRQRLAASGERLHQTMSAALDTLAASINGGDTDTALGLIRLVGVEHLLRAARPGPTTPLGVHARLAEQVRSDLISDYFCNPDIGWIVEQRSDNSAHGT